MADAGSHAFGIRLDIHKIQSDAQIRWLRPSEISEILQNYRQFHITTEAPNRPPSGSLFLFDRKVLRYFRKDGLNWRKKKDGKTVKEAHEKLKVGSVDAIHCYYAHGEANESFQRRSYWLLEPDYMHIVLVHYLEVKGNKANISSTKDNEVFSSNRNSWTSISPSNSKESHSTRNTDSTSPTSTLASLCEDAESEDGHQAVSNFRPSDALSQNKNDSVSSSIDSADFNSYLLNSNIGAHGCFPDGNELLKFTSPNGQYSIITESGNENGRMRNNGGVQINHNYGSWDQGIMQHSAFSASQMTLPVSQPITSGAVLKQEYSSIYSLADDQFVQSGFDISTPVQLNMMVSAEGDCSSVSQWAGDEKISLGVECKLNSRFEFQQVDAQPSFVQSSGYSCDQNENFSENGLLSHISNAEFKSPIELYSEKNGYSDITEKKFVLDGLQSQSLKKVDSFSKWISRELDEVEELNLRPNCGSYWGTIESHNTVDSSQLQLDTFSLSPSLSQDQLFSILEFSPSWAYTDSETKVLISGAFLINKEEVPKYNWSCMFGEVEIPVTVLSDCILRCHAPPGIVGRVPFYITCSNRLACSEIREFEYKEGLSSDVEALDVYGCKNSNLLQIRLEKLLHVNSSDSPATSIDEDKKPILNKIIYIMENDESYKMDDARFSHIVKEDIIQKLTKEKLYYWLFHKVSEIGKGPNILDDEGQGVLHLAASLGYDWAIQPILTAGVNINFRDINGWTSLHWASFCGRESTVALLVSLGAASGALTDPSPKFPLGRTPADLASANGFKGISGFLAEASLTSYLSSLSIDRKKSGLLENREMKAVQTVSERTATPTNVGDVPDMLSLRDSLTAVCNATQAADRIHQVFRMQSFREKQLENSACKDLVDVNSLPVFSLPARISGKADAAVIHIQKKFRGWKRRREFLLTRQRIVQIQAHVRGHQVRKHYKTIIWSVGIMEKVILRWRRKGAGLRGYRPEALSESFSSQQMPSKDDGYDFLKEGRKQTEERYQKALARVKSMAYYPEGRDQYRRLLTVVECFRKNKGEEEDGMGSDKEMKEEIIDFEKLVGDGMESFMEI